VGRALTALEEKDLDAVENYLTRLAPVKDAIIAPFLVTGRLLGRMAHSLGQSNRAIRFFEEALRFCRNAPYPCELAWTCYDYAPVLLERDRRGDRQKATALLEEALEIAETLRMRPLFGLAVSFRERYHAKLARKPGGLSRRELDVLELLAAGLTNKEIAEQLFISTNTVATHVAHILQKTRSANRTEAANYAIRNHLDGSARDRLENSQFG